MRNNVPPDDTSADFSIEHAQLRILGRRVKLLDRNTIAVAHDKDDSWFKDLKNLARYISMSLRSSISILIRM